MEFLKNVQNIEFIVLGVIALVLFVMWRKGKKAEVKAIVISVISALMTQVEQYLGSGKGQEKLDKVLQEYKKFVEKLPFVTRMLVNMFFSEQKIRNIIEDLVPQINNLFKRDTGGFEYFKKSVGKSLESDFREKHNAEVGIQYTRKFK